VHLRPVRFAPWAPVEPGHGERGARVAEGRDRAAPVAPRRGRRGTSPAAPHRVRRRAWGRRGSGPPRRRSSRAPSRYVWYERLRHQHHDGGRPVTPIRDASVDLLPVAVPQGPKRGAPPSAPCSPTTRAPMPRARPPQVTPELQSRHGLTVSLERLLTVREVAARLGVCTSTIGQVCGEGKLAHLRISNAIRVPADALAILGASRFQTSRSPLSRRHRGVHERRELGRSALA